MRFITTNHQLPSIQPCIEEKCIVRKVRHFYRIQRFGLHEMGAVKLVGTGMHRVTSDNLEGQDRKTLLMWFDYFHTEFALWDLWLGNVSDVSAIHYSALCICLEICRLSQCYTAHI